MTSSLNMLRERYDLYCLWKPFQHNCGLPFSKSAGITKKWEKSLIFLLSSKTNTSWQVIPTLKCYSSKRGENLPECRERWSMKKLHLDKSTTILFLCHMVPETTLTSSHFSHYFQRRRRLRWMFMQVEKYTPSESWGLLLTAVLI